MYYFKKILVLLLIFVINQATAQKKSVVDSLKKMLASDLSPQKRVQALNTLADEYTYVDSTIVANYAQQAIELANKIDDIKGKTEAYYTWGWSIMIKGNYPRARQFFGKVLESAQKNNYPKGQVKGYNGLGVLYKRQGYYAKALECYQKNVQVLKPLSDKKGLAKAYNNIGNIHFRQGNYPSAIQYYEKAIEFAPEVASRYQNLANVLYKQGNYPQSLSYYHKALTIEQKNNQSIGVAYCYNNIGNIHLEQKNYPRALHFLKQSLKIKESLKNKPALALGYCNIGELYHVQKNYSKAAGFFHKGLAHYQALEDTSGIAFAHRKLGVLALSQQKYSQAERYLSKALKWQQKKEEKQEVASVQVVLGQVYFKQQRYSQALQLVQQGVKAAQTLGVPEVVRNGAQILAQVYQAMGNYKAAYQQHVVFKTMADSLYNTEGVKKIAHLEVQHAYEKKQDSLKLAQTTERLKLEANLREKAVTQRSLIAGLVLLVILVFTIGLFYWSKQQSNRLLAMANSQLVTLDGFKQQMMGMIVHDLKNPLNSIIGLSEEQKDPRFFAKINHAAHRMQNLILNILDVQKMEESKLLLHKTKHPVSSVIQEARQRVQLTVWEKKQRINFEAPVEVAADIDQDLMNRVMVNLLTNAIKYSPAEEAIEIKLAPSEDQKFCKVSVSNVGVGIAAEHLDKIFDRFQQVAPQKLGFMRSTGLGLTFCKLAVEAHGGSIGVESVPGKNTTFWFTLPITPTQEAIASHSVISTVQSFSVNSHEWNFNRKELKILTPLTAQIGECPIYETSTIRQLLEGIDESASTQLLNWKNEMKDAVYAYDEVRFQELLEIAPKDQKQQSNEG